MSSVFVPSNLHEFKYLDDETVPLDSFADGNVGTEETWSKASVAALAVHVGSTFDHVFVLFESVTSVLQIEHLLILLFDKRSKVSIDLTDRMSLFIFSFLL